MVGHMNSKFVERHTYNVKSRLFLSFTRVDDEPETGYFKLPIIKVVISQGYKVLKEILKKRR